MKKFLDRLFSVIDNACRLMLSIQVVVIFIVVVGRYVFNKTPAWGEALTLFLLVWVALLGAALVLREDSHIRVTIIDSLVPPVVVKVLTILSDLVLIAFSVLLLYAGYQLTKQTMNSVISGLGISRAYMYGATLIFASFIFIAEAENLVKHIKALREKEVSEE